MELHRVAFVRYMAVFGLDRAVFGIHRDGCV